MTPDGSYKSIPGSDKLRTEPVGADREIAALESADRAALVGAEVAGQWLARTHVREGFVPVLVDVFDRLSLGLEPLEQLVYLHLYRLALGEELNFCRVSRSELESRTRLSDRRLGKALAGLVEKDHIRLVQRDRAGTLYRVMLPHEVLGEADGGRVHLTRSSANRVPKSKPVNSVEDRSLTLGSVVAGFIDRFGEKRGRTRADVVEAVLDRLEDGASLETVQDELQAFGERAPARTPITELGRFSSR